MSKDLGAVTKQFKALTNKIGQLTTSLRKTAVEELEHAQAAIKLKSPAQHAADALKALTRQTDKLIKAVEKFDKGKAARQQKTKGEAAKKPFAKKGAAKKPAAKKAPRVTATDQVLKIVKRSKKGVDVPTLMKKTGLQERTVRNIVFRAFKQGKIKRVAKGLYVGV